MFIRKEECCGCAACRDICPEGAISMIHDEEGFLYPQIDQDLCIDCGLCMKVCSFRLKDGTLFEIKEPLVFAAKHKSDAARFNSTSGGAFIAISDAILDYGGTVYGAKMEQNFGIRHARAVTRRARDEFRGSKYAQSDMQGIHAAIVKDLGNGKNVMFSGLPCQAEAVRSFVRQVEAPSERLVAVDLLCYGVPSAVLFQEHISSLENLHRAKACGYSFRPKHFGWSSHIEEIEFEGGAKDHSSEASQLFKRLFLNNLCLRPSCHECKLASRHRVSDITIGDYWGAGRRFRDFKDELGLSVVIVSTDAGRKLLHEIKMRMDMRASDMEDCSRKQMSLNAPQNRNPARDAFWKDYRRFGYTYAASKHAGGKAV